MFNLLSNASKFTNEGHVSLDVTATSSNGEEAISFCVRDTGIGITPEQKEKLFQPFVQADSSTSRNFGGTGLGLVISQRFCTMMGGSISLESVLGEGSAFTMEIPRKVVPRPLDVAETPWASRSSLPPPAEGERPVVLAIDDDESVLDLLERSLEKEGFRVAKARSGKEGLRLAEELRPAAITLDVLMPDMDGWAVLDELKADPTLSQIPVVIVTMTDDMGRGFTLGATDFLAKPVDRSRLLEVLAPLKPADRPWKVLVVEDDPASQDVLVRLLQKEGCKIDVAGNGLEALKRLASSTPDLILLDLMMPEMNGFELVSKLSQDPNHRAIPIVVVTAQDLTEEDKIRLRGHVSQVFQKGAISRDQLLQELRTLLDSRVSGGGG